jgi:hypothetical protein
VERLAKLGLGFGGFRMARRTLAGYEAIAMIRKGQTRSIGGRDMKAQAGSLIAEMIQSVPDLHPTASIRDPRQSAQQNHPR